MFYRVARTTIPFPLSKSPSRKATLNERWHRTRVFADADDYGLFNSMLSDFRGAGSFVALTGARVPTH